MGWHNAGRRTGRYAAGERNIIVDVELKKVEEGVGYKGDCAIEFYEPDCSQ